MARRTNQRTFFFRHDRADGNPTDIYLRLRPTAVRFSQANKGSVRDTLGGYYRELIDSDDPQYRGLMLPSLVVEADTGVAYRRDIKRIDWIWRNRGLTKPNGAPADLFLFDVGGANWSTNINASRAGYSTRFSFDVGGVDINRIAGAFGVPTLNDFYDSALSEIGGQAADLIDGTLSGLQSGESLGEAVFNEASGYLLDSVTGSPIAQVGVDLLRNALGFGRPYPEGTHENTPWNHQGVERYAMRVYQVEILNFAWDDSIQSQNHIRFSMQLKILRDLTWDSYDGFYGRSPQNEVSRSIIQEAITGATDAAAQSIPLEAENSDI